MLLTRTDIIHSKNVTELQFFSLFRVGLEYPTVEVRYQNLCIEAECEVVHGKPLPTLWNSLTRVLSVSPMHISINSIAI